MLSRKLIACGALLTTTPTMAKWRLSLKRNDIAQVERQALCPSTPVRSRFWPWILRLVACCLMTPIGVLLAQTITVAPTGYVTVGLGGTVQYTATVTGLTNTDVTWSAGNVVGGNSVSGTISTGGLYTAPAAVPGQNPVAIKATSKADTSLRATVYINILPAGPTLSTVSPNPLPTGSVNITLTGSGFKAGAVVMETYNGSNTQIAANTITNSTITASIYQGAASSASFTVINPGSMPSNAIVVPVSGGSNNEHKYVLTVANGQGAGSYSAGTTVNITANAPAPGQSFINWTGAVVANASNAATSLVMPASNTTVTANFTGPTQYTLTVISGQGSGSYLPGTVVNITANAPGLGMQFANWTGAPVANAISAATTVTMPSSNTSVTANYTQVAVNIPFPVTSHPRLWVTVNDLSRLRTWAVASNPIYAQGMAPLLSTAVRVYNNNFFPGGVQNPNYPDPGDTQGYQGNLTEHYGFILAFNSLIDPVASNRIKYAQYARNLLMVAMNEAVKGPLAGAPFRDPLFAVYNRANGQGEEWPLIVDWIYSATDGQGNPILTAADKLTIRNVFLLWANACINASTTGGDHPSPQGVTNSTQLLPGLKPYRMASNNYYLGHARLLTMMGLCIDPSDDPAVNVALPNSQMGNTLRSYILNANGAWLYQEFAMMGDPQTVATAYGLAGNGAGFGLSSGGLPPEGMLYGHSYAYILGQLLALQTAGFNNPAYSGPQIGLISAPVWDRFVNGYIASITPTPQVFPAAPWLGVVYQLASYGDLLRQYVTPDAMQPFSLLSLLEQAQGKMTPNTNAARWFAVNAIPGGAGSVMGNISNPFTWGATDPILYFLLFDPAAQAGVDPRPTFPNVFVDPAAGRIVAHSDWSSMNTMFSYRSSWISINHQLGDAGQFELYRNGEWLTKEMSNYDNNAVGLTTMFHNSLALQNWCPNGTPNLNWFETGEWANGSQWMLGMNGGDPVTVQSNSQNYVYAASDLTPLYNRPNIWNAANAAKDITQATRSILWLNNDYIVVYDRATSIHGGLFKKFNMNFVNNPQISGNVATATTPNGQHLFVQTLLPMAPSITSAQTAQQLNPIAELEPTRFTMTVQDPTLPKDTRFFHVMQASSAGVSMVPAMYLTNASGTSFDGAAFGSTAVFFPTNIGPFATTTFNVPATVHTLMVAGLTAGGSYNVTTQVTASGVTITVAAAAVGTKADSAGLLSVSF